VITFLSSPKPFVGLDADNQLRAIRSWQQAVPGAEIVLYGPLSLSESAQLPEWCRCVTETKTTPDGLPYFNDIVAHARIHVSHDIQIYLNCDIVLTDSLRAALPSLAGLSEFLVVGQRLDLIEGALVHPASSIISQLVDYVARGQVEVHPKTGMDYFLFRRGMWADLPSLIVGRGAYDNALLAYCLRRRIPVIDGTRAIVAVHQFHDYRHVPGGKRAVFSGREEGENRRRHDIVHGAPNIGDADFRLVRGMVQPNSGRSFLRQLELRLRFEWGWKLASYGIRLLRKILHAEVDAGTEQVNLLVLVDEYRRCNRRAEVSNA
jgi:hypothetical protein